MSSPSDLILQAAPTWVLISAKTLLLSSYFWKSLSAYLPWALCLMEGVLVLLLCWCYPCTLKGLKGLARWAVVTFHHGKCQQCWHICDSVLLWVGHCSHAWLRRGEDEQRGHSSHQALCCASGMALCSTCCACGAFALCQCLQSPQSTCAFNQVNASQGSEFDLLSCSMCCPIVDV